jgi:UDP-glucose 4-epimerase
MLTWVVGRGGLLGRHVERRIAGRSDVWTPDGTFSWNEPVRAKAELTQACERFAAAVDGGSWRIAWCAGAGVVASTPDRLESETEIFRHFLSSLSAAFSLPSRSQQGCLFLASSAGGVYAGANCSPYDEFSPVVPLSPYGFCKLDQEAAVSSWSQASRVKVLIGRISNLYGPGQNHQKSQGLISQVLLRVIARQPLHLYVPLDTTRDYLFVEDGARIVVDCLDRLAEEEISDGFPAMTKLICSQQPVTIGTVLAQTRWITKYPVKVVVGTLPSTAHQARDLRMRSRVWPEIDRPPLTPLSHGMRSVYADLLAAAQAGRIAPAALG